MVWEAGNMKSSLWITEPDETDFSGREFAPECQEEPSRNQTESPVYTWPSLQPLPDRGLRREEDTRYLCEKQVFVLSSVALPSSMRVNESPVRGLRGKRRSSESYLIRESIG